MHSSHIAQRISHSHPALTSQEPLESSTIFESVVIIPQLTFSLPLYLLT